MPVVLSSGRVSARVRNKENVAFVDSGGGKRRLSWRERQRGCPGCRGHCGWASVGETAPPFTCRRTYAGICSHGMSTEGPLGLGSAAWAQIWLFRTHSHASSGQCPTVLTCQMGVMIGPLAQACCMDQTRPLLRGGLSGAWHTDSAQKQKLLFLLGVGL